MPSTSNVTTTVSGSTRILIGAGAGAGGDGEEEKERGGGAAHGVTPIGGGTCLSGEDPREGALPSPATIDLSPTVSDDMT